MKRIITTALLLIMSFSVAFGYVKKVPVDQVKVKQAKRHEPAPTGEVHNANMLPTPTHDSRNSSSFTLVDSSMNGFGMVSSATRPIVVTEDDNWFIAYRQYAGYPGITHGQLGGAFSEDGEDWTSYNNVNCNQCPPPWGGGGFGGAGSAQARYPSVMATDEYPYTVWTEYTGLGTDGSYGGRPYYTYDEFGWDGGSFPEPMDVDAQYDYSKDLWIASAEMSLNDDEGMYVANVVFNDWTRASRWLFHSEYYEDGFLIFGEETEILSETDGCLAGVEEDGSYNSSAVVSMTPDGLGMVGMVGLFAGGIDDASDINNDHTAVFKMTDDHGASWYGDDNSCGYYHIPEEVFSDIVDTNFSEPYVDECEDTETTMNSVWTYYEFDMKVDASGNPHVVLSVMPCDDEFCYYLDNTGFYHFTIDRNYLDNPGQINTATGWNWSFVINGSQTWMFEDMAANSYIWNTQASISFSRDTEDIVFITTNLAEVGVTEGYDDADPYDCVEPFESYPEWSQEIMVSKSEDNGASWWNPMRATSTPDETGGVCPDGYPMCGPEEEYPHAAHWGTDDMVYIMFQMPNWDVNDIGDLTGPDFMNFVYAGFAEVTEPGEEYGGGESCNAAGDVNSDEVVNILDIVGIVNHILGTSLLDNAVLCAGDYNGDEIVNILDIVGIVNYILGNGRIVEDGSYSINGNTMNVTNVAGIQVDGTLISEVNGNDQAYSDNGKTIIFNMNGTLETDTFEFDSIGNKIVATLSGDVATEISQFSLTAAYPNPFNPSTMLSLNVPVEGHVSVKVFNISGQTIATLADGFMQASNYNFTWNATDAASGVYLVRAESAGQIATQKVMLLK